MNKNDDMDTCIKYDNQNYYKNELGREFDVAITPQLIASQIQKSINKLICDCPNVDWNENFLTFKLIEILRYVLSHYKMPGVIDDFSESKFSFEAYKLTGNAEKCHGDIAIIVTRKFCAETKPISGVAFYEAKASGVNGESLRYPSFSIQQLRRLVTNTPKLNYLLYSKDSEIVSRDWPVIEDISSYEQEYKYSSKPYANAITIDANFLKECKNIEMSTRAVGLPFGEHFVNRVLSGRELDYSRSVDETIRRWLRHTRKSAPYIISVSIQEEFNKPLSCQLELPRFEKIEFLDLTAKNRIGIKDY